MVVPSRLPLLASLAILGVGCSEYASTDGPEHCGSVGDQIWGKDLNPHDVTCDVTVTGDLTIGPDTKVRFASSAMLIVQGSLHIEGTSDQKVQFEPAEDGAGWVGLWVRPWEDQEAEQRPDPYGASAPARLAQGQVFIDHLNIVDAGLAPSVPVWTRPAAIVIDRGPVHMANVTVTNARQCGIAVGRDGRFGPDSTGNVVTSSSQPGICAHAEAVGDLPDIDIPEGSEIDVYGDTLTGRHVWPDKGAPYRITESLTLAYADLTLRPGTDLQIYPEARLQIGSTNDAPTYGAKQYRAPDGPLVQSRSARLHAEGTSTAPVTISAAPIAGEESRFDRVLVTGENNGHAEAVFEHTTISGGGAPLTSNPAAMQVGPNAIVTFNTVTIADGSGAGIRVDDKATITPESSGLTVTGNAYAASVHPNGAAQLPTEGSSYTGNDTVTALPRASGDFVYIDDGAFTATGTLADLGVVYVAEEDLAVEDPDTVNTTLTIDAGVVVRFTPGARFAAGTAQSVTLLAGDTAGDEVLFELAETEAEDPAWVGLELGTSLLSGSRLSNVRVSGAGLDTLGAAVEVLAPDLLIDGLTVDGSQHHGLLLKGTFAEGSRNLTIRNSTDTTATVSLDSVASLPEDGADLATNPEPFVRIDGTKLSKSGTWGDLGVPYFIDSQVRVSGELDGDDNAFAARLKVEPGVTIQFDDRGGLRTEAVINSNDTQKVPGTIELVGTSAAPILLTPRDPLVGWTGVVLNDDLLALDQADRNHLEHVVIEYGGAIFAQAAFTCDDATPTVANVTIRDSKRYGVALIGDAFVEDPLGARREQWDRGAYTFSDNYSACIEDPELPCPDDPDLIDFRVFVNP